jgi:hypothetical protein
MYSRLKGKVGNIVVVVLLLLLGTFLFQYVRQRGQHDFMPFYLGGKLAASGRIAHIYDKPAYRALIAQLRSEGERMSPFDANYFIRPAFEAFFYIPFTWLSYRHASTLALIGNIGLLGTLVWKLPIWLGVPTAIRSAVRFGLTIFYPFLWSIVLGQDTLLLTLLVGYSLSPGVMRRDGQAGVVLGLCAWKPNLTGLLPFALMTGGRWKMALYALATSSLLLAVSFVLVGAQGFRQWVELVQAPSSDITPSVMGNIRALNIHFGPVAAAGALLVTIVCCYFVARRGSLTDKVSAALLAALLLSPHTYLQDYSLASVIVLLGANRLAQIVLLLPWPYFYARKDVLPMVFLALCYLVFLAMKDGFRRQPAFEKESGIPGIAGN